MNEYDYNTDNFLLVVDNDEPLYRIKERFFAQSAARRVRRLTLITVKRCGNVKMMARVCAIDDEIRPSKINWQDVVDAWNIDYNEFLSR